MVSLSSDKPTLESFLKPLSPQDREAYRTIPEEIEFTPNEAFAREDAEMQLFGPGTERVNVPDWTHFPEVPEDTDTHSGPRIALSKSGEVALFLRYNFARYRLHHLLREQQIAPTTERAREMVRWHRRVLDTRSDLVKANMALVVAMAKRTRIPNIDFAELISEGNMALLRAVEKFDVARGFKFSTYGCRAILKGFNRLATRTGRYRNHFPMEFDPEMERSDYDVMRHEMQVRESVEDVREVLSLNVARLTDVERTIIMERFAIGTEHKPRTLQEVGKIVGLSNERVRQLQEVAMGKIRTVLAKDYLPA